jgi:phosphatidate cytidylyltransferase
MIQTIYITILSYFLLGGIAFYFINRKLERNKARLNWVKYLTYFVIINVLFLSIALKPSVFWYLGILIMLMGTGEMIRIFWLSGFRKKRFFGVSIVVLFLFCLGFFYFISLNNLLILFTFLILSIFDAFSQISGQLLGKRKIVPAISPGKTLEGLIGGVIIAIASSFLLHGLIDNSLLFTAIIASGIVLFAFTGDLAASFYKRNYNVKDFSDLLPGNGGFLDRFDSFIAGGTFIALLKIAGIL